MSALKYDKSYQKYKPHRFPLEEQWFAFDRITDRKLSIDFTNKDNKQLIERSRHRPGARKKTWPGRNSRRTYHFTSISNVLNTYPMQDYWGSSRHVFHFPSPSLFLHCVRKTSHQHSAQVSGHWQMLIRSRDLSKLISLTVVSRSCCLVPQRTLPAILFEFAAVNSMPTIPNRKLFSSLLGEVFYPFATIS